MNDELEETDEEVSSNPELEQEFRDVCDKVYPKISAQIEIARKAITKAEKLSEKYGVPFDSDITPLSMSYKPTSFDEKFGELDGDKVYDISGVCNMDYDGWEHSGVC
jgi:hypothetical protein